MSIFDKLFKKKAETVLVSINCSDALLMVRLTADGKPKAKMQCVVESDRNILIGDIQHTYEKTYYNKGYGTMMMEKLISYARNNHYDCIYGNLSVVDFDHKDRLHHFYNKFGFTVTEYPEVQGMYYGKIEIYL